MRLPELPTPIRYWLARLRPLQQPRFWVPLSGAILLGLFGWVVMNQPDWLEALSPKEAESSKPTPDEAEDLAIGADIDSLPVLFDQVGGGSQTEQPSPEASKPNATASGNGQPSSLVNILKALSSPGVPILGGGTASNNTGADMGRGLLFGGNSQGDMQGASLGLRSSGSPDPRLPNAPIGGNRVLSPSPETSVSGSPALSSSPSALANALSQLNTSPIGTASGTSPTTPVSPSANPWGNQWGTLTPQPAGTTPILQGSQPLPSAGFSPNVPIQGSTGMTPSGFSSGNVPNAYSQMQIPQAGFPETSATSVPIAPVPLPSTSISTEQTVLPGVTSVPTAQPQGTVQEVPFSIPRTPPGRYIGGGKINTFSNP